MITNQDGVFPKIIGDAYNKLSEPSIDARAGHSGSVVCGKVLHMRKGLVTITD